MMNITLRVWRQAGPDVEGAFETYEAKNISPDASFFEMLDEVNEKLKKVMVNAFREVVRIMEKHKVDMRIAALMLGVGRVADAAKDRGLYP